WNATISSCPSSPCSQQYTIRIIVGNSASTPSQYGYYTRNSSIDDTVMTVSQPGTNFITGGGYIVLASPSGLVAAGTSGTKNNFGFNVKYNSSHTNLQGNMNTIIRSTTCVAGLNCQNAAPYVYQIKGNSMTSLAVQLGAGGNPPNTATFNGK